MERSTISKIHLFKVKDKRFVLDVNSCVFFEIDELVYSILELIETVSPDELIDRLSMRYTRQDILRNLAEIQRLIEAKELFSEDRFEHFRAEDSLPPVSTLCMNVSHDCNLNCAYCFGEKYHQDRLLMSKDIAEKSVDFMIENGKNQKYLSISFFGGEPLLNFPVIEHTVQYAQEVGKKHDKHFNFHVTTNGTLLNAAKIAFLAENKFSMIISLDGPKEVNDSMRSFPDGKGTYDVVCRNIKEIQSLGDVLPFTVRSTFTRKNLDIENLAMHLASLGCRDISVEPCAIEIKELQIKEGDLEELKQHYDTLADRYLNEILCGRYFSFFHLKQMMDQTHRRNFRLTECGAGLGYLAVGADGMLYPCHRFVGQEEYEMGDVFSGIKNRDIQKTFLSVHVRSKEKCRQCWARYICGGGCHALAVMFNKDILQPYEIECELIKHRIKLGAYLYASLKDKNPLMFRNIYNESGKFC